ncbi:unnamed protein product [Prunus armeniaca]
MSQVFENCEAYWSWGDNDENTEEIIEFFADEAQENTSTSVEVKDDEVEETTTLPSSSKGKLLSTELRTLKRKFQTTKDELAKLEIEKLKKRNGGLNEHDEGHEEVGSPHINEGDDNDMSPLHEYITLITEPTKMEAQVSGDGAKAYAAMQVQEAEIGTSDWKNSDIKALRGQMNPPIITNVTVAGDEAIKKGSATVEKQDMEGKWGRTKWPTTTLLSPFTDPLRKKRMITISDVDATPPCFDPTNPCPLTMSRQ